MNKGRLEAFSDGVFAVIITIMVLELHAPAQASLEDLREVIPTFFSYILSFIYAAIYWNNHHHMFQAVERISGMTLWANLHLLFWLSLIPFVTSWMGRTHFATWPVAIYGGVLLMSALAWTLLAGVLVRCQGPGSTLARALAESRKEWISPLLYILGIALAFAGRWFPGTDDGRWGGIAGSVVYAVVAAIWFIPDRRIERALAVPPRT